MSNSFINPNISTADILANQARHKARMAGRYSASEIFDHLIDRIKDFEASLADDEEIGVRLANLGVAAEMHIRNVGFNNPSLIEFSGLDGDGNKANLIQHVSQLSFQLVAMRPIEKEPVRIGFKLEKKEY